MSGHNKWSTIKNKKAKTDAAKGKIFTKIGREIVIAVKTGGSADPALNSKLKDVIAKAKAANMPNDNIQRSIKKAAGEGESANYKEVTYEGYAPCGVAVIVEIVTDNLNRTASEMRHIFDKCGGSLGATGCVSWKFERKGVIVIDNAKGMDEDELTMLALDAGADDVEYNGDTAVIYTNPNDFSEVRHIFDKCGGSLGATGCVSWKFERKGVIVIDNAKGMDEDELTMLALDAGADDVEYNGDTAVIYTDPNDFSEVRDNLENAGCTFLSAERAMIPTSTTALPDEESVQKVTKLLDWLEEYDDTENVYHDAELPDDDEEDD